MAEPVAIVLGMVIDLRVQLRPLVDVRTFTTADPETNDVAQNSRKAGEYATAPALAGVATVVQLTASAEAIEFCVPPTVLKPTAHSTTETMPNALLVPAAPYEASVAVIVKVPVVENFTASEASTPLTNGGVVPPPVASVPVDVILGEPEYSRTVFPLLSCAVI